MKLLNDATSSREKILAAGQRLIAARGFSSVGLTEILSEAKVPKGSFYHYFDSKESFGEALLDRYFEAYMADVDEMMRRPGLTMARRLIGYFEGWHEHQAFADLEGRCLAVKLGAEVSDLSEAMRLALKRGTAEIIERLSFAIQAGAEEKSLAIDGDPKLTAENLYSLWLGASVMVKILRNETPLEAAMTTTKAILNVKS